MNCIPKKGTMNSANLFDYRLIAIANQLPLAGVFKIKTN